MKKVTLLLLFFIVLFGLSQSANAHSPIGGGGTTYPPKGGGPTVLMAPEIL